MCLLPDMRPLAALWLAPYPFADVTIPAFNNQRVLPSGRELVQVEDRRVFLPHECDLVEIEDHFVNAFPDSVTRRVLFDELNQFLAVAKDNIDCFWFHVSGEFVAGGENPDSILLIVDAAAKEFEEFDKKKLWFLYRFFNSEYTFGPEDDFTVQTRLVRAWPRGHVNHEGSHYKRLLALMRASYPIPDIEGGYIALTECEGRWDEYAPIFQTA